MKKSLLLAAASLAVISCSKRAMEAPENPGVQDPNAVQFSSGAVSVTPDTKVTTDATKGSIFETGDIIGIYAVYDGKTIEATDAFPAATDLQYKNKKYKVSSVNAASPYEATFTPNAASETIYYLPGKVAYNYYAFFPTAEVNAPSINSNFVFEDKSSLGSSSFVNQTELFTQDPTTLAVTKNLAYPGPMMYAYYDQADAAATNGGTKSPVALGFKYANAKLSVEIERDITAGADGIESIELIADEGLIYGYTFDLKQADETTPQVVKQGLSTGSPIKLDGKTGSGSSKTAYRFQNLIDQKFDVAGGVTTAKSHFTGYLIPATGIENARIEVTIGSGSAAQTYTAYLDKSLTGENLAGGTNYLENIVAGKEYKFKLKIKKSGVDFTGTIADWSVETPQGSDDIWAE